MTILLVLIVLHLMVLMTGKYVRKLEFKGLLLVGFLTFLQVVLVGYLLFTMEVPQM